MTKIAVTECSPWLAANLREARSAKELGAKNTRSLSSLFQKSGKSYTLHAKRCA